MAVASGSIAVLFMEPGGTMSLMRSIMTRNACRRRHSETGLRKIRNAFASFAPFTGRPQPEMASQLDSLARIERQHNRSNMGRLHDRAAHSEIKSLPVRDGFDIQHLDAVIVLNANQ
jgi:hypothetical protein